MATVVGFRSIPLLTHRNGQKKGAAKWLTNATDAMATGDVIAVQDRENPATLDSVRRAKIRAVFVADQVSANLVAVKESVSQNPCCSPSWYGEETLPHRRGAPRMKAQSPGFRLRRDYAKEQRKLSSRRLGRMDTQNAELLLAQNEGLSVSDQFRWGESKCRSDSVNHRQRGIPFSPFDPANVGSMDFHLISKSLL